MYVCVLTNHESLHSLHSLHRPTARLERASNARPAMSHRGHNGCHGCNGGQGALAMYRSMNGNSVFTGFVNLNNGKPTEERVFKLDDPTGALDGPGHIADPTEFLSQMALYDDGPTQHQVEIACRAFPDKHNNMTPQEWAHLDSYMEHLGEPNYPVIHFFPDDSSSIRADDRILMTALGEGVDRQGKKCPAHERFWADVLSITPCGKITAISMNTLKWSAVAKHDPILVRVENVIASSHGEHWESE